MSVCHLKAIVNFQPGPGAKAPIKRQYKGLDEQKSLLNQATIVQR
jgi:hypothetical protein